MISRQTLKCAGSSRGIGRESRTDPNLRSPNGVTIEAFFLERAKYYQFAAAMTENPWEIERLRDVALMFERMARDVRRRQQGQTRFYAACWHKGK